MSENPTSKHRAIRSFVRREGRMTDGQKRALSKLMPQFDICSQDKNDSNSVFNCSPAIELEIGCGNGDAILAMAKSNPDHQYIAVDVHRPGIGKLLLELEQQELSNVWVSHEDINVLLKNIIPDESLFRIMIFFPDPWHKKKHHKRRLIQPDFLNILVEKLAPNGELHIATDWENYAQHIVEVIAQVSTLEQLSKDSPYTPRPNHRPETRFERRGLKLGHEVFDIITRKAS